MTDQPNPAVVPDPPQPQERSYTVTGVQGYLDYRPGEQFTATLPFDQEALLLQAGVLKVIDEPDTSEPAPEDITSDDEPPPAPADEPKPHQRPHRSRHTPSRPETIPSPDPADQE